VRSPIRSAGVDKKCNSCLIRTLKRRQQRVSTARATSREQCVLTDSEYPFPSGTKKSLPHNSSAYLSFSRQVCG
jgi:hypothetical protein